MKGEIIRSLDYLKNENIILYPTDTVWGIGCDATSDKALAKFVTEKKYFMFA